MMAIKKNYHDHTGHVAIKTRTLGYTIWSGPNVESIMKIFETYKGMMFTDVPGKLNLIEHWIILNNEDLVRLNPYALPHAVGEELKGEIKDMLELGIIRESESPYASPIVIESYLC